MMSDSRAAILGVAWLLMVATLSNIGPVATAEEQKPVPSASLLPSLAPTSPVVGTAPGLEPTGASNTTPPVLPVTQTSALSADPAVESPEAPTASPNSPVPGGLLYIPGSAAAWSSNNVGELSIEKYLGPGAPGASPRDSAAPSPTAVAAATAVENGRSSPAWPETNAGHADREAAAGNVWPAWLMPWLTNNERPWSVVVSVAAAAVALVLVIVAIAVWRARRAGHFPVPAPVFALPSTSPGAQSGKRAAPKPEPPQQPARRAA